MTNTALLVGLLVDVATLTVQLYLSGGIANPFVFLYLLQVVLAAELLKAWSAWLVVALTCACVIGLTLFPGPVHLPGGPLGDLDNPYLFGLLLCFALIAVCWWCSSSASATSSAPATRAWPRCASARPRRAHRAHGPVGLGRGARTGHAAGDDGGDPRRLAAPAAVRVRAGAARGRHRDAGAGAALQTIVSNILATAGETRGEEPRGTTLRAFLDDLVDEWKRSRAVRGFEYHDRIQRDARSSPTPACSRCCGTSSTTRSRPRVRGWRWRRRCSRTRWCSPCATTAGFPPEMIERIGKPTSPARARRAAAWACSWR